MVGWIVCGMKEVKDGKWARSVTFLLDDLTPNRFAAYLGDTFHLTNSPMPPLESFKPLKSMVFAGIYPLDPGGFTKLEEAIRRVSSHCIFRTSLRADRSLASTVDPDGSIRHLKS